MDPGDAEESSDDPEPVLRMGDRPGRRPRLGDGEDGHPAPGPGAVVALAASCDRGPRSATGRSWRQSWNPFGMCSWPPEDDRIESFQRHVRDQAKAVLGADLARSEKFTTSVMDGLDIRETLRNWHTGDLYVKVMPPSRGSIEVVVFLFDVPADPSLYTSRATWYAEHAEESTLAFYATDHMKNADRPGHRPGRVRRGLLPLPPRPIPDIWIDPRLDFADTLEERLLAGAFLHSRERHVAVVSPRPPAASWRRLARAIRPQDRPPAPEAIRRPARRAAPPVPRPQRQDRPIVRGRLHPRYLRKDPHDLARPGPDRAGRPLPCPPRPSRPPSTG